MGTNVVYVVQYFGFSKGWKDSAEFLDEAEARKHLAVLREKIGRAVGPLRLIHRQEIALDADAF